MKCEAIFHGSLEDKSYKIYPNKNDNFNHLGSFAQSCHCKINELPANHSGKWSIVTTYKTSEDIEKIHKDTVFIYEIEVRLFFKITIEIGGKIVKE